MVTSRWFLLAGVISVALWALVFAGIAQAQLLEGTNSGDVLTGTQYGDKAYGYGGADTLTLKGGGDLGDGGDGADTIDLGCGWDEAYGGDGEDLIYATCDDGKGDYISCGRNDDIVFWRVNGSVILPNCETQIHVTGSGD